MITFSYNELRLSNNYPKLFNYGILRTGETNAKLQGL